MPPRVDGVEIHDASAAEADRLVRAAGGDPNIITSDFFLVEPEPKYTAVIGNPPYIRFQDFSGEARTRSRAAALQAGVNMSGLASSWAAFTVHSALMLRKGGRLALVVPAELLSVNYAAEVRRFLFDRFAHVDLVMFTERVFPEVQEEVVLLLADGYETGSAKHASIYQAQNAAALSETLSATTWTPSDPSEKWTPSLLSADALNVYSGLLASGDFRPLETWGDTTLGMVTGNNKYFSMSPAKAAELEIPQSELLKLSPPGSRPPVEVGRLVCRVAGGEFTAAGVLASEPLGFPIERRKSRRIARSVESASQIVEVASVERASRVYEVIRFCHYSTLLPPVASMA